MANTTEGTVQIAGAGTSPDANKKLYDDWAEKYEQDVRAWGYRMPEVCAETLKKYAPAGKESSYKVLDAGAGDGISGKAIVAQGFKEVTGIDLSPELIKIANKNGIYKTAEVADLSKPLKYKMDEFDAMTVVGVMTYLEPDGCSLDEMCRVVKTGGLVIMTHRTDKVDLWKPKQEKLVKEGKWEVVDISEPHPYLPNNPEYGEKIKVIVHTYRIGKKDKAPKLKKPKFGKVGKVRPEMKGLNFYMKCVKTAEAVEGSDIKECLCGDETGCVLLSLRSDAHVALCTPGALLRVQNTNVRMVKGKIRLVVDKWSALKVAESVEFETVNEKTNVSETEYELK